MKLKLRILAIVICILVMIATAGCQSTPETTEPTITTTLPPEPAPEEQYLEAVDLFQNAQNYTLTITRSKDMTVGAETFTETTEQTLTVLNAGSDTVRITMDETLTIGETSIEFTEQYIDGIAYMTADACAFSAEMPADTYYDRYAPLVMFDCSLYASIATNEEMGSLVFKFEQASDAENWVLPEDGVFEKAAGQAIVDASGNLTESTYRISYSLGTAEIDETITVSAKATSISEISAEYDADECTTLTVNDFNMPKMLEKACLYLTESDSVSGNVSSTIFSQAGGVIRTDSNIIDMNGNGINLNAKVDTSIGFMDQSSSVTYEQTEYFKNGTYTLIADDADAENISGVTSELMDIYCKNILLDNIISLTYVDAFTCTDLGGVYLLEVTGSEAMATALNNNICTILFEDPTLLDDLASHYETNTVEFYLAIDKYTGFPTASGINYSGTHVIEEISYELSSEVNQSISVSSLTAYEAVTETPAEAEEMDAPTPLFYRVTGSDGQEMWLLGTIHLGDNRTSMLPQEIYDALNGADALAVEFDTIAYEEVLEEDEALQAALMEAMIFMDDTTVKDHLDSETYETALKWLKASGGYHSNMERFKPIFWEQSIGNFYIQQGYSLTSDHGVDNRLLQLAKESGKEVISIESAQFQSDMLGAYSEELQEWLLCDTLTMDMMEYAAETQLLYEQWCAGDEATLRETLADTGEDLTEDELRLYKEYNDAMIIDRNDGMLDAAIEYLESGRVIFYAVGLAHLLQDNGLVDTLRDAGYTVTQVTFN